MDDLESRSAISRVDGRLGSAEVNSAPQLEPARRGLFPLGFWWVALGGAILISAFSCQSNRVDAGVESSPHQPSLPQHTPNSPDQPWITPDGFDIGNLA